jgi:ABC-type multidrug transport system fused ATPase/permease subunit
MRFYDPEHGKILLDGVDIKEYNLHSLRNAISLVMQEPIVFNYTLSENILYGNLDASNEEIQAAAEVANCTEFIEKTDLSAKVDDSAASLIEAMKMNQNKQQLVGAFGQEKYDTSLAILEKCEKQEQLKSFQTKEGDIDSREEKNPALVKTPLHKGYRVKAGLRGSKLSGG